MAISTAAYAKNSVLTIFYLSEKWIWKLFIDNPRARAQGRIRPGDADVARSLIIFHESDDPRAKLQMIRDLFDRIGIEGTVEIFTYRGIDEVLRKVSV